jgi:hypothetical protein
MSCPILPGNEKYVAEKNFTMVGSGIYQVTAEEVPK